MNTHTQCLVLPSTYRDSVLLMHLSRTLEQLPGVRQAAVMMGTPNNKDVLRQVGLLPDEGEAAGANDLLVCVQAETPAIATEALRLATDHLTRQHRQAHSTNVAPPRTLETALRRLPEANLACISVPGHYASREVRQALRHGLHVLLFSAHVDLTTEAELKHLAAQRGLLLMGPDCGTAVLNGVPLGFANALPRGAVGLIAASGTGLQQVSCLLAQQGIGISQAIGVGGRDLHQHIRGQSMRAALQALARDADTRVLVLIAKPPAPAVAACLAQEAAQSGKPCVLAFLGDTLTPGPSPLVHTVTTLEDAARVAAALVREAPLPPPGAGLPEHLWPVVEVARSALQPTQRAVRGLYCGGTLAYEALWLLRRALEQVDSNLDETMQTSGAVTHAVLDLGAEEFTQGRPHPMIDPEIRRQHLLALAQQPEVAVVLCDVVLGWGAHPDPATALADAWREAQALAHAAGRTLVGVASVCGTPGDPQGLERQCQVLQGQGIIVAASNAQAVRLAAAIIGASEEALSTASLVGDASSPSIIPEQPYAAVPFPSQLPALWSTGPRVINLGLELFATPLAILGVPVLHVDWRPPAGGDTRLTGILERLR